MPLKLADSTDFGLCPARESPQQGRYTDLVKEYLHDSEDWVLLEVEVEAQWDGKDQLVNGLFLDAGPWCCEGFYAYEQDSSEDAEDIVYYDERIQEHAKKYGNGQSFMALFSRGSIGSDPPFWTDAGYEYGCAWLEVDGDPIFID